MKSFWQYLVPQKALTQFAGLVVKMAPFALSQRIIRRFIRRYGVDMSEALQADVSQYNNFNDFFTRLLKPEARPVCQESDAIVSPADGKISQIGDLQGNRVLQVKGHSFSVTELLGGDVNRGELFMDGKFATIYLSPKDYHRVHMPYAGTLKEMIYVPGKLFSVSCQSAKDIKNLYARNERVICLFETDRGMMAVILVGAMVVGSINTVWHGDVTPPREKAIHQWCYPNPKVEHVALEKGDELGLFKLGSTVIVLFQEQQMDWSSALAEHCEVKFGEKIGHLF